MGQALAEPAVIEIWRVAVAAMVTCALRDGVVITVEQRAVPPFRMGQAEAVVEARAQWVNE